MMSAGAGSEGEHAHAPVLLAEVLHALDIKQQGLYIDATYGRGGHAAAILDRLGRDGCLVAMDRDAEAVEHARRKLGHDPRCFVVQAELKDVDTRFAELSLERDADGVLADLGVSSPQLDQPERGFSFTRDGPLDMRMDTRSKLDAATWLNQAEEGELIRVLRELGEERYAVRIARAVVQERKTRRLSGTTQLADLVCRVVPTRERGKHPATRTFQAVRMRVNSELEQLGAFLPKAMRLLAIGGRLVVISFHSLEDRLVKRFMREQARGDAYPPDLPVVADEIKPRLRLVGKPVRPSQREIDLNPRARSAVMRVAERTACCHA